MDDKQLAKLVRKNAEKAAKLAKARSKRFIDPTIEATSPPEEDDDAAIERAHFFKEMKRREF
jgi:hypothetical protein